MNDGKVLRGGIDLGGTKIQTAIVDAGGEVLGEARRPTPTEGGPAGVAEQMAEALREAASAAGVEPAQLEGVGVGSPGDADEKTGVVSSAKNLPDWEGSFPLAEALKEALGTEVRVGNDVQVATEAEFHLGAGREFESLIGVFWGTGVGGGLVLDGRPWLGRGAAGEIGHVVVKRGGAKCPCGRKGCMEAYAGRSAMEAEARREHEEGHKTDLFKLMEKHGKPRLTSGIWERAIDHGDEMATKLIDRAIEALGTGVASAVNLIDPEAIIIGGGLGIRFGERYMDPLMEEMSKHLFLDQKPPAVRVATLGDLGGAVGASLLFAR
ncbi:MAG: glucokinase [Solirubrobacterales bacterium]|jgi:glucokinase|nr:glucokinase [Solirubrobacterales bacterium]